MSITWLALQHSTTHPRPKGTYVFKTDGECRYVRTGTLCNLRGNQKGKTEKLPVEHLKRKKVAPRRATRHKTGYESEDTQTHRGNKCLRAKTERQQLP
jgi:hypothetical protein